MRNSLAVHPWGTVFRNSVLKLPGSVSLLGWLSFVGAPGVPCGWPFFRGACSLELNALLGKPGTLCPRCRVMSFETLELRRPRVSRPSTELLGFPASCGHVNHITQPA